MARPDQDLAVPLRAPRLTLATAPDLEASPAPTPRRAVPAWLVPLSVVTAVVVLGLVVALWRSRARTAEPALAQVSSNEPSVPSSTVSPVETAERPIAIQVPTARPMTTTPPTRSPTLPAPSPRGPELASARAPALPVLPPTPPAPTPSTTAPPPPDAPAIAPSFVLASARVEVGTATNTIGTTATNVNRAIAPLTDRMTACYRAALPQMHEPFAGTGTLHIETDEDGVITVARVLGNITAPATCIAAAASGRRLANVDTGRARADVPVSFKAR